jgi:hypothetical protein
MQAFGQGQHHRMVEFLCPGGYIFDKFEYTGGRGACPHAYMIDGCTSASGPCHA